MLSMVLCLIHLHRASSESSRLCFNQSIKRFLIYGAGKARKVVA